MAIHRIPTELLCDFFAAAVPLEQEARLDSITSPLLVSQVSQKWRQVAIADPRLWSTLNVRINSTTRPGYKHLVQLFLDRSATQCLSISITADERTLPNHEIRTIAKAIFNILSNESHRWRRLSVVIPASHGLLSNLCAPHAPNLSQLSLQSGVWTEKEALDVNKFLQNTPALRHFVWNKRASWGSWDQPFDSGIDQLCICWNSLTDIVIDAWVSLKTVLDICKQSTSIVSLNLRHFASSPELLDASTSDYEEYNTPLRLRHLKSLSIYQLDVDAGPGALLDRLICPDLRHFSFACGFITRDKWFQSSFHSFLERSSCQLESLSLEMTGIEDTQLIQCLEQTTNSLTSLEVYDAKGDISVRDELLGMLHSCQTMTAFGKCATLCPKLHTLNLSHVVDCTDGTLANLLQSRTASAITRRGCTRCVPLKKIDIVFSRRFQGTNRTDLNYLRNLNRE